MEGQGKRLLVAVVLALGVLLAFQMFFAKKEPPPPPKAGSAAAPVAMTTIVGTTPTPEKSAEVKRGPEQTIPVAFPGRFDAAFSSYGGVLKSWKLLDPRYERDQTKGELLPALPDTGAFFVEFNNESTIRLPAQTEWIGTKISDTQIRYELKTADVELVKTFTIFPDNYVLKMELSAKLNVPAGKQANQILVVTAYGFQDPDKIEKGSGDAEPRGWASSTMRAGKIVHTPVASVNKWPRYEDKIKWTGFEHPYMLAAYAPHLDATQTASKYTFAREPRGLMRTEIALAPQEVFKPGDAAIKREFVAYLGPKHYDTLDLADSVAGFSTGFKETIDMGWFAFIGRPLLWLLQMFHGWFGNWAIAIVLLTFIVKAATLYWTTKSMRSMKAMAALAPQMKILQEKYKDDRQRQQAETMALYKQHGVNPIAGCLPIILQMPIWFALYRMLSTAGELYNQPFIVGWIDDLTKTDPYHILNILLVVTMFAQARLSPQTGDSMQQKFMQYGVPVMFGFFSFFFPAGLSIYIFTNTVLSAVHSIYMNKYDKKSLEIAERMKKAAEQSAQAQAAGSKSKAKPVIDVDSDDDDEDAGAASGAAKSAGSSSNPRRKRKKRRR